jgi:hypothetical protein
MKDLIIAVADSYQEKVLDALLPRVPVTSGTRNFTYDIIVNPGHDAGSYNDSHELLRPFINEYRHALILLDFEGTGVENKTREEIENDIESLLGKNGWHDRNEVIVIAPELENWMWMDNPHVADAIGWKRAESLYDWAKNTGYLLQNEVKPERPKEALEAALKISDTPKSAAIYKNIASKASYRRCEDPSFKQMINTLQQWFHMI